MLKSICLLDKDFVQKKKYYTFCFLKTSLRLHPAHPGIKKSAVKVQFQMGPFDLPHFHPHEWRKTKFDLRIMNVSRENHAARIRLNNLLQIPSKHFSSETLFQFSNFTSAATELNLKEVFGFNIFSSNGFLQAEYCSTCTCTLGPWAICVYDHVKSIVSKVAPLDNQWCLILKVAPRLINVTKSSLKVRNTRCTEKHERI